MGNKVHCQNSGVLYYKKGQYWLNKKKYVTLKYCITLITVLRTQNKSLKSYFFFFTFQVLKKWELFYFYLSNFFGHHFYFYLPVSNFLASYLYFYLSTQTRYLLQHCVNASILYILDVVTSAAAGVNDVTHGGGKEPASPW